MGGRWAGWAWVLLAGCSSRTPEGISGTVTYNGVEVEEAYVTFYPAEDRGPTRGAEVKNGRYTARNLGPGKWRVVVTARPQLRATSANGERPRVEAVPPKTPIPAEAIGNNEVVEFTSETRTHDLHLKSPPR